MTKQKIIGFHQDEDGDGVAELGCGHTQHVRHNPPWTFHKSQQGWTRSDIINLKRTTYRYMYIFAR